MQTLELASGDPQELGRLSIVQSSRAVVASWTKTAASGQTRTPSSSAFSLGIWASISSGKPLIVMLNLPTWMASFTTR